MKVKEQLLTTEDTVTPLDIWDFKYSTQQLLLMKFVVDTRVDKDIIMVWSSKDRYLPAFLSKKYVKDCQVSSFRSATGKENYYYCVPKQYVLEHTYDRLSLPSFQKVFPGYITILDTPEARWEYIHNLIDAPHWVSLIKKG